tara:strand:- start:339 stop:620 length:282 start_codon:yes stop_codon:yes gene_type:complete
MRKLEDIELNSVWLVWEHDGYYQTRVVEAHTSKSEARERVSTLYKNHRKSVKAKNTQVTHNYSVEEIRLYGDKVRERATMHQEYMKERNEIKN